MLAGGFGDDTLDGGAGNDTLRGGAGGDLLIGGAGIDAAVYTDAAGGVTVDLLQPGDNLGDAAGDVFSGIENVVGSSFNDVLRGGNVANTLSGFTGNDILYGLDGNDRLVGGDGNDILFGGAGADRLEGGAGSDTASYTDATGGVRVDLIASGFNTGFAQGDTLFGIEQLVGSNFADILAGSNGGDSIFGRGGDDSIDGRDGNDTLAGEGGDDVLQGRDGNDVLRGGAGADRLFGGNGADILFGGSQGDELNGGAGFDFVSYTDAATGIVLDLLAPGTNGGDAAGDVLIAVENLVGSNFTDIISGGNVANNISGRGGNDTIVGRGGADTLRGEGGRDRLDGGAGADVLTGGAGDDRFIYRETSESTAGIRDTITDFAGSGSAGGDLMDLSTIDANANAAGNQSFAFIGQGAFTGAAGQLRYETAGGNATVQADTNGDGTADLVVDLTGVTSMVASDFVL